MTAEGSGQAQNAADRGGLVRDRLRRHVHERPGVSLQELADHVGVTRTAVVYHMRRLEKGREVSTLRQGNRVLHFPTHVQAPELRSLVGVLRLRNAGMILDALQRDPTTPWRKLARILRVGSHTVRWHVRRMEDEGIIRIADHAGRKHVVHLHAGLVGRQIPAFGEPTLHEGNDETRPTDGAVSPTLRDP